MIWHNGVLGNFHLICSLMIIAIELIDRRLIQLIGIFMMIFFLEIIFDLVIFNSETFLSYFSW